MNIQPMHPSFTDTSPIIIAGPCSAEGQEQLLTIAHQIKNNLKTNSMVKIFRAGVWKPRTRPNNFEGLGEIALPWLQQVKKETGLLVATEVATAKHVEACLKHDIDILWIGARTTANPFSVQEIADCLKGVNIPVMVKNPINADLQLWIGALERLNLAGITKLAAIHRGFSVAHKLELRNDPQWKIPIELKAKFPTLPLLCDPSHISGNRSMIAKLAQKAMDLDMTGLMIETHHTPDLAWSDANQQITPQSLEFILQNLKIKSETSHDKNFDHNLELLRGKIDRLDFELIEILHQRKGIVEEIAHSKMAQNITALQLHRFQELMTTRLDFAKKCHLNELFIKEIFDIIHEDSIRNQMEIFEK